jgi:formate hydrogenlyase subunit 4
MTSSWLLTAQAVLFVAISPLSVGAVDWLKARIQGRRGPDPTQPYHDLWKLLRIRPSVPSSASGIFLLAPAVVFATFVVLGFALPTVYVPAGPGPDLLLVIALIGLAKFASTLAAFDAGSPLAPMSSGRQWFIHVLAEPALLVASYIFAINRATTNLSPLATGNGARLLVGEPAIPLAIGALLFVLLAENGRLPFDRPGTHLELTMVEEGAGLEYNGRALALVWWSGAMKLTFGLSLVVTLALPPGTADGRAQPVLPIALVIYLAKLAAVLALLAWWESSRVKVRIRAVLTPLMLATGVLLFAFVTLVVQFIEPNS